MGLCVINIASFFYIDKEFENVKELNCFARIISIREEKEYTNKYIVRILNDKNNYNIKNTKLIIYTEKTSDFLPGDVIHLEGNFSKASSKRNFGGFDYNRYLKQFKIFGIVKVHKTEKISEKKNIFLYLENIRRDILNRIDGLYNNEKSGFLKSLLFGEKNDVSEEIKFNFRNSNILHILAISGMHVSYVILFLKILLDKLIKNKKVKNYILILCLIIFLILTGNSVSCIRACIMSSMILLAKNLERKNNFYFSFIYSLIITIIYNPYNIYNVGLWLSYMGTLGIVLLNPFLKRYICYKLKIKNRKNNLFLKVFFKSIFENFTISISAQILIWPILMYTFNTVSISFFISNILISFFIGPILILGYITVILSYLKNPFLETIIYIEEFFIEIILNISKICASIPFSKIYVTTPNFMFIIFYYSIILFFVYIFYQKRMYIIKLLISFKFIKNESIRFKDKIVIKIKYVKKICKTYKFLVAIIIIIYILFNYNFIVINKEALQINFIDVGQGDCTYIKTPKGKNIIIDGGEGHSEKYDYGQNVVLPYLLDKKVKKINYVFITHADNDHIGGLFAVIENIEVDKIIIGTQPEHSRAYLELLETSKRKKIEIIQLSAKKIISIEKNIFIEALWPIENSLIKENALNNNSLVIKMNYNKFSILFTGDIEKIAEKQIAEEYKNTNLLRSDIIKIAHHGSKTSSTEDFLKMTEAKIALIGVGKENKFGHPNDIILNRLEKLGINIFRTDNNGEINILVNDKGKIKVKTLY